MEMNVKAFLEFVNKATVNYSIESLQLNYDKEKDIV